MLDSAHYHATGLILGLISQYVDYHCTHQAYYNHEHGHPGDCPDEQTLHSILYGFLKRPLRRPGVGIMEEEVVTTIEDCGCESEHARMLSTIAEVHATRAALLSTNKKHAADATFAIRKVSRSVSMEDLVRFLDSVGARASEWAFIQWPPIK